MQHLTKIVNQNFTHFISPKTKKDERELVLFVLPNYQVLFEQNHLFRMHKIFCYDAIVVYT
jgi:hypothetical protein